MKKYLYCLQEMLHSIGVNVFFKHSPIKEIENINQNLGRQNILFRKYLNIYLKKKMQI